jgi:hypothetical protein
VLEVNSREGIKKNYRVLPVIGLLTTKITLEGPVVKVKTIVYSGGRIPIQTGYWDDPGKQADITTVGKFLRPERRYYSHKIQRRITIYTSTDTFSRDRFLFNNEIHMPTRM